MTDLFLKLIFTAADVAPSWLTAHNLTNSSTPAQIAAAALGSDTITRKYSLGTASMPILIDQLNSKNNVIKSQYLSLLYVLTGVEKPGADPDATEIAYWTTWENTRQAVVAADRAAVAAIVKANPISTPPYGNDARQQTW
jgi:hypothetical protein